LDFWGLSKRESLNVILVSNGKKKKDSKLELSAHFLSLIEQTKERFETIFEKDGFMNLKRKLDGENSLSR